MSNTNPQLDQNIGVLEEAEHVGKHYMMFDHMHDKGGPREVRVAFGVRGSHGEIMYVSRREVADLHARLTNFLMATR